MRSRVCCHSNSHAGKLFWGPDEFEAKSKRRVAGEVTTSRNKRHVFGHIKGETAVCSTKRPRNEVQSYSRCRMVRSGQIKTNAAREALVMTSISFAETSIKLRWHLVRLSFVRWLLMRRFSCSWCSLCVWCDDFRVCGVHFACDATFLMFVVFMVRVMLDSMDIAWRRHSAALAKFAWNVCALCLVRWMNTKKRLRGDFKTILKRRYSRVLPECLLRWIVLSVCSDNGEIGS